MLHLETDSCANVGADASAVTRKRKVSDDDIGSCPKKVASASSHTGRSRKRISPSVKKERKREQNKTAALRYRQKKKQEKTGFEVLEQDLEEKNSKLRKTVQSLQTEIDYLKKLWSEVEAAKRSRAQ